MKNVIVIGAGITGSVISRILAEHGYNIQLIEKRNHIGGNMYDYVDEQSQCLIHKYGPHTFHTNKKHILNFISKFEQWKSFTLFC